MTKKRRAKIERRIEEAFQAGLQGRPLKQPQPSAEGLAHEFGRKGVEPDALIRRLVRWHTAVSQIGWCHWTFNPWLGCCPVSSGCKNCYAEEMLDGRLRKNLWGRKKQRQETKKWRSKVERFRKISEDPMWRHEFGLKAGERPRIFPWNFSDWAEGRPEQRPLVARMWEIIREHDWADWLLLTKRPQNVPALLPSDWGEGWRHVWPGVSVESGEDHVIDAELQTPVIERARIILRVPAEIHWLSYEPALGPLDFRHYLRGRSCDACRGEGYTGSASEPVRCPVCRGSGMVRFRWVVYGGESGPRFRPEGTPEDPQLWARDMRAACDDTGAAFYFKQSAHRFNERGQELDGKRIQEYPR